MLFWLARIGGHDKAGWLLEAMLPDPGPLTSRFNCSAKFGRVDDADLWRGSADPTEILGPMDSCFQNIGPEKSEAGLPRGNSPVVEDFG